MPLASLNTNVFRSGEIQFDQPAARDRGVDALLEDFDAVFLGVGATVGQPLNIPGGDAEGVMTSLDFLTKINLEQREQGKLGDKIIVIGGAGVWPWMRSERAAGCSPRQSICGGADGDGVRLTI